MRSLLVLFFSLSSSVVALAAPAPNVAEVAARYRNLSISPSSVSVQNLQLRSGHLTITLGSGTAAPVMAGDAQVGIFFQGDGKFEYTSEDPLEFAVMQYNLKNGAKLALEKNDRKLTVSGNVERLLFLSAGAPLPKLEGAAAVSLADAFQKHRQLFAMDPYDAVEHPFVERELDAPNQPYVRVEMTGGKDRLLHVYDPFTARSEILYTLHSSAHNVVELKEFLTRSPVSEQMIGRDRRDPLPPPYLLTAVDYTLTASDANDAELDVTETVVAQGSARKTLRFAMYNWTFGNRWRKHAYNISEITDAAGNKLSFDHRNDELIVGLATPAQPNVPVKLRFRIAGDFLIRPEGDNFWQLGVEPWFPQPALNGMYYTVHSRVKVKGDFVPFAPGKTIERKSENGYQILESVVEKPVAFTVVHSGKYKFAEETRNGVTVRVATYAMSNPNAMKRLTGLAFDIIEFYNFVLGEFPFPELNIIEVPQYGWGQAPPGTIFITRELFDRQEPGYGFSEAEVNARFAHEIAHQYWGQVVKMPSYEEQWLTESFAEYSAALFIERAYGKKGKAQFDRIKSTWKGNAAFAKDDSSIALANRLRTPNEPPIAGSDRFNLLYGKGPLVLHALRAELGDDAFLTFMKSYQRSFAWKFGTTNHLAGLLKFMTKKDYAPFFESHYWGTEMPKN